MDPALLPPFYGARCPGEISLLAKTLRGEGGAPPDRKAVFRPVLSAVVEALGATGEAKSTTTTADEDGVGTGPAEAVASETERVLFSGMFVLLTRALRTRNLTPEKFREDLEQIRIPEEYLADVATAFRKAAMGRSNPLPYDSFRWRTEVTISSDALARIMQPSVLMQFRTGTEAVTFEVSKEKLEEMRLGVARCLADVHALEQMPILKLDA